jgi:hypothetical protein
VGVKRASACLSLLVGACGLSACGGLALLQAELQGDAGRVTSDGGGAAGTTDQASDAGALPDASAPPDASAADAGVLDVPPAFSSHVLWLRADRNVEVDDAGRVERWRPVLGDRPNLVSQPTASARPSLTSDAFGGHAAIRFDATNQEHLFPNMPQVPLELREATMFFVVARAATATSAGDIVASCSGNANSKLSFLASDNALSIYGEVPGAGIGQPTGLSTTLSLGAGSFNGWHLLAVRLQDDRVELFVDGALVVDTPWTRVVDGGPSFLLGAIGSQCGSGSFLDGSVAELIAYDEPLSDDRVDDVFAYLNQRYGPVP